MHTGRQTRRVLRQEPYAKAPAFAPLKADNPAGSRPAASPRPAGLAIAPRFRGPSSMLAIDRRDFLAPRMSLLISATAHAQVSSDCGQRRFNRLAAVPPALIGVEVQGRIGWRIIKAFSNAITTSSASKVSAKESIG
jgi:hypothetical protein